MSTTKRLAQYELKFYMGISIVSWMILKYNTIIGSTRQLTRIDFSSLPNVLLMGTPIPYCDVVKNLGVIFDRTLSWSRQVGEVSRKIFSSMSSLRRLRNVLPIRTKIQLAQSLLLPILDYADACYLDASEELLNK